MPNKLNSSLFQDYANCFSSQLAAAANNNDDDDDEDLKAFLTNQSSVENKENQNSKYSSQPVKDSNFYRINSNSSDSWSQSNSSTSSSSYSSISSTNTIVPTFMANASHAADDSITSSNSRSLFSSNVNQTRSNYDDDENTQIKRRKFFEAEIKGTFVETSFVNKTQTPLISQSNFDSLCIKSNRNKTNNTLIIEANSDDDTNYDDDDNKLLQNMSLHDLDEFDDDDENTNNFKQQEKMNNNSNNNASKSNKSGETFYGLPMKVKELLKSERKIGALYDWQNDVLKRMQQQPPQTNLLYLSPTSGGKTLVAEILILQCLLVNKKDCIFIMPFVSIVQEKVQMMEPFAEHLRFYVEEYAGIKGQLPPTKRQLSMNKHTLYICTIEKAHSLINSLIETGRLIDEIGLVVADELHMIGDGPRGAIYEIILSKIKYCSNAAKERALREKKKNENEKPYHGIQIVSTTATLQNKKELAEFLNAYLYERDFRPVELKEYIKLDKQIFELDKTKLNQIYDDGDSSFVKLIRTLDYSSYTSEMRTADPDGLLALVKEVIPDESCLIFCSTKKNCENVAQLLATHLPDTFKAHKRDLKLKLFNELKEENGNNICPVLRKTLQYGIAYHHSGLTTEERLLIEQAYRDGVLCVITCTSTLAAGVNLPAKRVIIRSPYVARDFISTHQYKQMIGRAGRAGLIESVGESFLMFQASDRAKVYELISGPMTRCESSFQHSDSKAIRILVLSLIGLNICNSGSELLNFFKQTLYYIQQKKLLNAKSSSSEEKKTCRIVVDESSTISIPIEFDYIFTALVYLIKKKFVSIKSLLLPTTQAQSFCNETIESIINLPSGTQTLTQQSSSSSSSSSSLPLSNGEAPSSLSLSSSSIYVVDDEIIKNLYISHFEVTRLGMAAIKGSIDLDYANHLYNDLNVGLKSMVLSNYLHLLYLCTPYDLVNSLTNVDYDTYSTKYLNLSADEIECARIIGVYEEYIQKKRFNKATTKKMNESILKRFYMTLIIYDLWKSNNSLWKVSNDFQLDRGFVQQIIQSSASFTSGVLHFCENLDEFWAYKNLLQEFTKRLQYNCSAVELLPLMELSGVKLARARQLFNAGFQTLDAVAAADPDDMANKVRNLLPAAAKRIIKSANILKEKAELLQNEAANLLMQVKNDGK